MMLLVAGYLSTFAALLVPDSFKLSGLKGNTV